MIVQLDQNIVLDLFLNRAPWAADAATIWQAHVDGRVRAAIAAFTLPTVFYIVRRHAGLATARAAVRACILTLDIAPVDHSTLVLAESLNGRDFEDGRLTTSDVCHAGSRPDLGTTGAKRRNFPTGPLPIRSPKPLINMTRLPPSPPRRNNPAIESAPHFGGARAVSRKFPPRHRQGHAAT